MCTSIPRCPISGGGSVRATAHTLAPATPAPDLAPDPPVRSLHRPRGVGHGGAQAAGEPDAGDGEVSLSPEGKGGGGEPTGAHAHTPAYLHRGAAWRVACELRDCIAWRGVAWRLAACAGVARAPGGMRPPCRPARGGRRHAVTRCTRTRRSSPRRMPRRRSPYTPYISSYLPVSPQVIKKNCTFDINRRGGMSTP